MAVVIFILFLLLVLGLTVKIKDTPKSPNFEKPYDYSNQPKKTELDIELTQEFKEILDILNNSDESIFITGKAGTGKSSLLRYFLKKTRKKCVVLAPTGIAALNVGGQTIHSFFKFPIGILNGKNITPDYVRAGLFAQLQTVIIDEVSMVRADLMNAVDIALRKNRNRLNEPFGGVQLVLIGDLFQLPPVLTIEDRHEILSKYKGQYFFDAPVFQNFTYHFKELTKIFRQSEEQVQFKNLLNRIRDNKVAFDDMALLNSRHRENVGEHSNSIFLTSRRKIASDINTDKLKQLRSEEFVFTGSLSGKYSKLLEKDVDSIDDSLPAPYKLQLKKGAQIMMLRNDIGKKWVNGSIGRVSKISQDSISVEIESKEYRVEKEKWQEVEYFLNPTTQEIEERVISAFIQYPMQLAYAITIHKAQGKTFSKVTIDIGSSAFAHGQIYVALSRCTTLEGIILNNPIKNSDIIVDERIINFYKKPTQIPDPVAIPIAPIPIIGVKELINQAINEKKTIEVEYQNYNGEYSSRKISKIEKSKEYGEGYIKAFCHKRNEDRVFKLDRIRKIDFISN